MTTTEYQPRDCWGNPVAAEDETPNAWAFEAPGALEVDGTNPDIAVQVSRSGNAFQLQWTRGGSPETVFTGTEISTLLAGLVEILAQV